MEEFEKLIAYISERTNMAEGYLSVSIIKDSKCFDWIKEVNEKIEEYYKELSQKEAKE